MAICKCPVCGCGIEVNEINSQLKSEYMGMTYFFKKPECKRIFDESPVKYAAVC
jgi:YHS domain-containing protein